MCRARYEIEYHSQTSSAVRTNFYVRCFLSSYHRDESDCMVRAWMELIVLIQCINFQERHLTTNRKGNKPANQFRRVILRERKTVFNGKYKLIVSDPHKLAPWEDNRIALTLLYCDINIISHVALEKRGYWNLFNCVIRVFFSGQTFEIEEYSSVLSVNPKRDSRDVLFLSCGHTYTLSLLAYSSC